MGWMAQIAAVTVALFYLSEIVRHLRRIANQLEKNKHD